MCANHISLYEFKKLISKGESLKQILDSCPNNLTNNGLVNLYYSHGLRLGDTVYIFLYLYPIS